MSLKSIPRHASGQTGGQERCRSAQGRVLEGRGGTRTQREIKIWLREEDARRAASCCTSTRVASLRTHREGDQLGDVLVFHHHSLAHSTITHMSTPPSLCGSKGGLGRRPAEGNVVGRTKDRAEATDLKRMTQVISEANDDNHETQRALTRLANFRYLPSYAPRPTHACTAGLSSALIHQQPSIFPGCLPCDHLRLVVMPAYTQLLSFRLSSVSISISSLHPSIHPGLHLLHQHTIHGIQSIRPSHPDTYVHASSHPSRAPSSGSQTEAKGTVSTSQQVGSMARTNMSALRVL